MLDNAGGSDQRERRGEAPATKDPVEAALGRGGARRRIAWDEWDTSSLDARGRARVGEVWRERRRQEHLAVGAFALLASELAAEGCEPVVLALLARAVSDEARHAEVCRRMAVGLLGEPAVPTHLRGVPSVPRHPDASAADRALYHMVEMCCLSETFTGAYLTEMLARATHPVARAAVESLLEDEIDHGRVGWAYLATRAAEQRLGALAAELPAMLDRTIGRVLRAARRDPEPDDPAREAFGFLGHDAGATLFTRTLHDVVFPGFELCGVDLGPARAAAAAGSW
jgi:hypothetical protein